MPFPPPELVAKLVQALRGLVEHEADAPTDADRALVNGLALALRAYDAEQAKFSEAMVTVLERLHAQAVRMKAERELDKAAEEDAKVPVFRAFGETDFDGPLISAEDLARGLASRPREPDE